MLVSQASQSNVIDYSHQRQVEIVVEIVDVTPDGLEARDAV